MTRPLRMLIVEDSSADVELILRELKRGGFEPTWTRVETEAELEQALQRQQWDVVVSDHSLPRLEATSALAMVRQAAPDVPFVVVSGTISEKMAVEMMRAGASDYIPKGNLARLTGALNRELREAENRRARIHAENERDHLLNRHRLQLERMPLAYVLTDAKLRVVDWNLAAERMFGYRRDEVLGMGPPYERLVPASVRPQIQGVLERIRTGDMAAHSVNENLTKDGRIITCEWQNTPMLDDEGTFLGFLGLGQDITARREAEAALRLRDRAIHAVTQGIVITDPLERDNPIIFASPGFLRLTGYRIDEVMGRNCRFLQGKDTDPASIAQLGEAVRAGRPCTVELINHRKDGSAFWNELSIAPLADDEGNVTHFVGVQTDVTQRRRLEEQYRQAQKMEAIGLLAGGVAHDFNNLLTIINGYSDLLLRGLLPDGDATELVTEIRKAGERSATLTRQLLTFSRQQVVVPKILDLNEVLRGLEKMLPRIIGEDVKFSTSLDARLGTVQADPGQIEQVIMNLAVNARDAMPQGGQLRIETRNVDWDGDSALAHPGFGPGPYVLLSISDTGAGMPPEVRSRVFEPFFTTKKTGKGTGLGLAVVHGIVEQSGGHIDVNSEPGVGTTFEIHLPRTGLQATGRAAASEVPTPDTLGTETVLVVEDEASVRALTLRILTDRGYTVLESSDGEEALRLAECHAGPIHLLITDVVMPNVGGPKLAELMSARHPETRVLYVSGYTDDAVFRHGLLNERVAFLQKPFSPLGLARKVREALDAGHEPPSPAP